MKESDGPWDGPMDKEGLLDGARDMDGSTLGVYESVSMKDGIRETDGCWDGSMDAEGLWEGL